ncbi:conjugal transfer protein [Streptomyces venezuelae]|uniref:conjugal transfer protein n=1 Tax=Streptomyces venezuelae TaxID=54571 RepID=UPI003415EE92
MKSLRKALTLPRKKAAGGDEFASAVAHHAHRDAAGDAQGPHSASPEAPSAATPPAGPPPARGPAAREPRAPRAGRTYPDPDAWDEEREGSGRGRRVGKAVLWAVVGLMAAGGVRAAFFPPTPTVVHDKRPATPANARDDVPEADAQQVAARYARSYLTWSAANPKARGEELARDLPKGADTDAGWDGNGSQLVAQTIPGTVRQTAPHQARVSVDARVSSTQGSGKKARTVSSWHRLEIPVAASGGRVLVAGEPALVGLRSPVDWKAPGQPTPDNDFSRKTRTAIVAFFKAWADGTENQATAPGAAISPIGSDLTFRALDSWAAQKGSGPRRTGIAEVRWEMAGAVVQQTYRITLDEVTASGASRWQVRQVTSL